MFENAKESSDRAAFYVEGSVAVKHDQGCRRWTEMAAMPRRVTESVKGGHESVGRTYQSPDHANPSSLSAWLAVRE